MVIINNSIQQVICETNSLEVLHILQHLDDLNTHVYASLLVKVFGLNEHIPKKKIQQVFREGNCCTNFLAKLRHSSWLSVIFLKVPSLKLKTMSKLDTPS